MVSKQKFFTKRPLSQEISYKKPFLCKCVVLHIIFQTYCKIIDWIILQNKQTKQWCGHYLTTKIWHWKSHWKNRVTLKIIIMVNYCLLDLLSSLKVLFLDAFANTGILQSYKLKYNCFITDYSKHFILNILSKIVSVKKVTDNFIYLFIYFFFDLFHLIFYWGTFYFVKWCIALVCIYP